MKKLILIAFFVLTGATLSVNAQVADTVSVNPGYTHQTYYSLQNGKTPAVDNTDWDVAFQIRGFAASILINSKNNVHLYRANKSASQWASMTAADTTGILNATYELNNSDSTWDQGAFSTTYDTSNAFDLGWGVYDFVTHAVTGDSLYFIQLQPGVYKKLWIESLTAGYFYFRWADLDGSNEITAWLNKAAFQGKFFAYFSFVNNVSIDREPVLHNEWDLLFTQYLAVRPFIYKVTGVLLNDSVYAAKAYPVDVTTADPAMYARTGDIATIGYDWKAYDFANNVWAIEDSLVYFVQDRNLGIWKVIFTAFDGSSTGNYYFTKEYLGVTGVDEPTVNPILSLYPNPASDVLNLVIAKQQVDKNSTINVVNSLGQVVVSSYVSLSNDLNTITVPVNDLPNGVYFLTVQQNGRTSSKSFIVQ